MNWIQRHRQPRSWPRGADRRVTRCSSEAHTWPPGSGGAPTLDSEGTDTTTNDAFLAEVPRAS